MSTEPQLTFPLPAEPKATRGGGHTLGAWFLALAGLLVLTLVMFGDVLFLPGDKVLSSRHTDIFGQFIHWRAFGFGELRDGNLPLWNPHLFCGAPYFGGFQSALLYPPNALFLVLPLPKAINWSIALHVFLSGAFAYMWTAHRRLHPLACFLAAVMFMFCGAHFMHIYGGHLPNLCTLVWAPLLFLAIDGLFEVPCLGWSLLGMFAVAMQVLAGHPQYVAYTGMAAGIYAVLCCFKAQAPMRFLLGLAGIVLGGASLSAVQLLTGLQESREVVRSAGLTYDVAAMFSFPPENFLTLLAPKVFGDMNDVAYWGRCYLWEMSLFLSVTGLVLAVVGAIWGGSQRRRFAVTMVLVLFVLALGAHTPLLKLLYHLAPGFDRFRGNSKIIFLASLFLAFLAGLGLDLLLGGRRLPRVFRIAVVAAAVLPAAGGLYLLEAEPSAAAPETAWHKFMLAIQHTHEVYLPAAAYDDLHFVGQAASLASTSLLLGAGTLVVVAGLLFVVNRWRRGISLLVLLATGELFWFGRSSLDYFALSDAAAAVKRVLTDRTGDYRILNLAGPPDTALSTGARDLWGYDPCVLRRYAELMALTQGQAPNNSSQYLPFSHDHPLYAMLRLRLRLVPEKDGIKVYASTNAMSQLQLISRCRVITRHDALFAALTNATFNPREEVILETEPHPQPQPSPNPGTVRLLDSSTDHLTIEAEVKSPCLLLITDTYAKGWRARSLPGSVKAAYEVMPANYCLRAVPLATGHHRLRLEYAPLGFRVGRWVSVASVVTYCGLVAWLLRRARRTGGRQAEFKLAYPGEATAAKAV